MAAEVMSAPDNPMSSTKPLKPLKSLKPLKPLKLLKSLKPEKPGAGKEGRKSAGKRRHVETYSVYIYRVLKQVHPELGISKKGMSIVNSFVNDIFERLTAQASELVRCHKKRTLSSREVQTAVRFVLPNELAKHAVAEGIKACTKHANI